MSGRGKRLSKPKKLSKSKKQNIKKPFISEENKQKIKDRILFATEEEKAEWKRIEKKELKEKLIKDRIVEDIRKCFEQKEILKQ